MAEKYVLTPLMKQYYSVKAEYPDALILFRAGDFYETFGEDAVKSSSVLGITLTKRANGSASSVPLAGFPYHALDTYLPRLVASGLRVAICEQLEDPKTAKGIVKRGVTELVTPGITFNDNILSYHENCFLASIFFGATDTAGVSLVDVSTGEFFAGEGSLTYVDKILSSMQPKEVIYNSSQKELYEKFLAERYPSYRMDEWAWNTQNNREKITRQFEVASLKGFGIESMPLAITAIGATLHYLDYTKHTALGHMRSISRLDEDKYVWIDRYTIRNLEIFGSTSEGGTSLCEVIDKTKSPGGGRMLRRWLSLPLRSVEQITLRQDVVECLLKNRALLVQTEELLSSLGDPERIGGKIAAQRVNPREVVALSHALKAAKKLKSLCTEQELLRPLAQKIDPLEQVVTRIETTLLKEPAAIISRGAVISNGVDAELDELRSISKNGKDYLLQIQQREIATTGISSLKISYNNVFGYYIEVRNTHKDKVPTEWIRKQTLVNAERYITPELKEYEHKIMGAEGRIAEIEARLFDELTNELMQYVGSIKNTAAALSSLDTLQSFARTAIDNNYHRPQVNESLTIDIRQGRHPVIETRLPVGQRYIPNDVLLNDSTQQIIIITGPNMSGKSALLRQTALIVLLAQIGSYVPAEQASIGVVDRLFTRVGASDNISQGESTFMVEMLESAGILNNLSSRSLVLLDEIGRGTSTYDGISIAWAMVEYLHSKPGARTLFATHYHELNELEHLFERIRNYNVAVREIEGKVIFLRKLVEGGTAHSFGIHVAQMAGMPRKVVERAGEVLASLEGQRSGDKTDGRVKKGGKRVLAPKSSAIAPAMQMSFFQLDDPTLLSVRDTIRGLDLDNLTPREALDRLYEIKHLVNG
ncbi:MAG: DNA mismatch repair protein MutS [Mucinivorans sp.]